MLHASSRPVTFQSTRPVRGETGDPAESVVEILISIHSPRAGRDSPAEARRSGWANFNPLAPCGARQLVHAYSAIAIEFQSTRPVRGETTSAHLPHATSIYFNPLAPCGARLYGPSQFSFFMSFQSTRPVRGETDHPPDEEPENKISIHSPRAGRDKAEILSSSGISAFQSTRPVRGETSCGLSIFHHVTDFNPLAPCGARPAGATW